MAQCSGYGGKYTTEKSEGSLCVGVTLEQVVFGQTMYRALLETQGSPYNTFI
jgi:hypothetical protein